ncbi:MAG TPA: ester cyclase family protein [Thermomicrobiales bacterium]|nr:ester cyclase family protein [Thermomicrobiales bacterium]
MNLSGPRALVLTLSATRRRLLGLTSAGIVTLTAGRRSFDVLAQDASPTACASTTTDESIAVATAYFDAFNNGDADALGDLLAADYRHHGALVKDQDRDLHIQRLLTNLAAFPDGHYEIEDITANGDLVAVRHIFSGTLQGEYAGVQPAGQPVKVRAVHIHKVECGQIVETWNSGDGLGVLRQIGALPPAGASPRTPIDEIASPVGSPAADCPPGTPDENVAIASHWTEALDRHAVDELDEFVAENMIHHNGLYLDTNGRDEVKANLEALIASFPDVRFSVDVVVADDDSAVVRWTGRGTNDGDFQGNPPTGIAVTFTGINSYHIVCGQMVEGWSDVDSLQLLQQLGLVPMVFPGPATPTS